MNNMYYDRSNKAILTEHMLMLCGFPKDDSDKLKSVGVFPLQMNKPPHDLLTQNVEAIGDPYPIGEDYAYMQDFKVTNKDVESVKSSLKQILEDTLTECDKRGTRATQDIIAGVGDEEDHTVLQGLRAVAAQNRDLLRQLLAATTWEEASAIRPYEPWKEETTTPPTESVEEVAE